MHNGHRFSQRRSLCRSLVGVAALLVAASTLAPRLAHAGPVFPGGTLVITKEPVDTGSADWEKQLKKTQVDTLTKVVDAWKVFLVAYLNKSAGADEVNLVFYDITAPKQREQVNAFPVATKANAKIIASSIDISPEQGFKAGNKYQVLVTRLIGGKEVIYARTTLSLK